MDESYGQLADLFAALAHPERLRILQMLRNGECCVCHIETALQKRQAYVSQQLMVLREAGIVQSRRDGLQVYYWIADLRVVRLLDDLLGSVGDVRTIIAGCPCPSCAVVPIGEIH